MAYLADINDRTYQQNMRKLQCSCSSPHVEVRIRLNGSRYAQVRASQRAVVYEAPDGSWQVPGSNDPNDPVAVRAAHDGYVRKEFHSIRELREFQRSHRMRSDDDTTAANEVLDFDEGSRRSDDTMTRDRYATREREARLREAFKFIKSVGGGAGSRYDRAVESLRRRNR